MFTNKDRFFPNINRAAENRSRPTRFTSPQMEEPTQATTISAHTHTYSKHAHNGEETIQKKTLALAKTE